MQKRKFYPLLFSILVVVIFRVFLNLLPSFEVDMNSWLGWANKLSSEGLSKFYSSSGWTQYTPGYLYYLWLIGKAGLVNEMAIKIPVLIADIGVGLLIWSLIKKVNLKVAYISFFVYVLNPFLIFDGSVWGQIDGILTLFLFLSAYYLIEKKSLSWSVFFWSIAFLIKPQSVAVLPVFLFSIFTRNIDIKKVPRAIIVGLLTIFLGALPFFPTNPILGLPQLIIEMGKYYSYTSVNAFNIWTWVGIWKPDSALFIGLPLSVWGSLFLGISTALALYMYRNKINTKANYYLLFAILSLCFFLFPTRVHERYVFPFFAFILTSAGLMKSSGLFAIYGVSSLITLANIYYPYSYYNENFLKNINLQNFSLGLAKIIGFIYLAIYFCLVYWKRVGKKIDSFVNVFITKIKLILKGQREDSETPLPSIKIDQKKLKIILISILIFGFFTRIYNLGFPKNEYFDEVYHAFTAKVILHGGVEAWEWWNTPPEGFAYEWTHPPLAKLGMYLGMRVFGESSFGWRVPEALLGVGSIFMVYLLAKIIFKDEVIGLISAAVFSLDGMPLVMSRIGMNDSYILFFSLLTIYFFYRKKNFWSALFYGFALASKWSAIWIIPILGVMFLRRKKKFELSILWFLVLPFVVYISTYIPMFLTGHNLSIWWEMQKQMWWYHTNLRATHPYTSPWWSWPLMIRPIYLYMNEEIKNMPARIYLMGNPFVAWFGLLSIILSLIYSYLEKNKKLGLIVFCYLVFFVPWAASPRIMFLYHYLPSVPFLAIATGYILRRNPKLLFGYFVFGLLMFIYFYPHWIGLRIPAFLDQSYYWFPSWR